MGMACHPARPASRLGAEEAPPWLYTGNRKKAALFQDRQFFFQGTGNLSISSPGRTDIF